MLLRLFLLFTVVPFVEFALLIWIGSKTSWLVSVAMVILPGLIGAWLVRLEGIRVWRLAREQVARGELPAAQLLEGLLVLIAGVLLIAPGVLTDLTGLALLIRPIRRFVRRRITERYRARIVPFMPGDAPRGPSGDKIIDVHVVDRRGEEDGP